MKSKIFLAVFSLICLNIILRPLFASSVFFSQPLALNDTVLELYGNPFVLKSVEFEQKSDKLKAQSLKSLDDLAGQLMKMKSMEIKLTVYTDNQGDSSVLVNLTKKRANSIKKYLLDKGVEAYRIYSVGCGGQNPIAPNNTAEGRAKNNRVELQKKVVDDGYDKPVVFENVKFSSVSDTLFSSSYPALMKFGKEMSRNKSVKFKIIGHTSSFGSEDYNLNVSLSRAKAVKNYLVEQCHINPSRIEVEGRGDRFPVALDRSEQGRLLNNRIEICFQKPKKK